MVRGEFFCVIKNPSEKGRGEIYVINMYVYNLSLVTNPPSVQPLTTHLRTASARYAANGLPAGYVTSRQAAIPLRTK